MRNLKWPQVILILGFLGGGLVLIIFSRGEAMTASGGGLLGTVTGWVGRTLMSAKE